MKGVLQWVKGHYKPLASALLFAALALFLLLGADAPDEIEIAAVYDEQDHTLQVEQTIRYVNRSELELDSVYLYLHANAFATRERAPVPGLGAVAGLSGGLFGGLTPPWKRCLETGRRPPGPWTAHSKTSCWWPWMRRWARGSGWSWSSATPCNCRKKPPALRLSEKDVRLLNAFAIPAYHDGSAWQLHEYSAIGDPFVSTVADYTVTLQAPSSFVAAGPGLHEGEDGVWRFKARDLREFALVLCKDYCVAQAEGRRPDGAGLCL